MARHWGNGNARAPPVDVPRRVSAAAGWQGCQLADLKELADLTIDANVYENKHTPSEHVCFQPMAYSTGTLMAGGSE